MGETCNTLGIGEMKSAKLQSENLKRSDHLDGDDGRIILK
jgi:hypothetical protein